jgi:hypothetical protein
MITVSEVSTETGFCAGLIPLDRMDEPSAYKKQQVDIPAVSYPVLAIS